MPVRINNLVLCSLDEGMKHQADWKWGFWTQQWLSKAGHLELSDAVTAIGLDTASDYEAYIAHPIPYICHVGYLP